MQIVEAINALDDVFTRRALKCLRHLESVEWSPETEPAPSLTGLVDWRDLPRTVTVELDRSTVLKWAAGGVMAAAATILRWAIGGRAEQRQAAVA